MGVVGLARVLANELGPHDVNVNVVAPGHIDTLRGASAEQMSTVSKDRPMARKGLPEEVAAMVRQLSEAGATIWRIGQGESWTPMHDKFALVETPTERRSVFGSFNWSEPSRRFNREIGVVSADEPLFEALERRWSELGRHAEREGTGSD